MFVGVGHECELPHRIVGVLRSTRDRSQVVQENIGILAREHIERVEEERSGVWGDQGDIGAHRDSLTVDDP